MLVMKEELRILAERYEVASFIEGDPSWFMHQYSDPVSQERAGWIASALSYGSRKQFLPKIQYILDGGEIPENDDCFYRLHTNRMVRKFLNVTDGIYKEYGSILGLMKEQGVHTALEAVRVLTTYYAERGASDLIPKNANSSCKRVCMFLRWMVRDGSAVDLGLWKDQIDKRTLIMPMDTHVMQEAQKLGLISSRTGSMATALKLTERLREFFPDDPTKGDFALFGKSLSPSPSPEEGEE